MITLLRKNAAFLFPYLLFICVGALLFMFYDKTNLHLLFNHFHYHVFDSFFAYATYLGDGWLPLFLFIVFLFVNYRWAVAFGLSNLIAAGITQLLKHTLYSNVARPAKHFTDNTILKFVQGVDINYENSFPSGHATSAFATFFCLSLFSSDKSVKFICFIAAIVTAYSRVFLNQHFFNDIYAGSIIGTTVTLFVFYYFENKQHKQLDGRLLKK